MASLWGTAMVPEMEACLVRLSALSQFPGIGAGVTGLVGAGDGAGVTGHVPHATGHSSLTKAP